jgi:hypothetical protein
MMCPVVVGLFGQLRRARPLAGEHRRGKRSNHEEDARRRGLKKPSHTRKSIHPANLRKAIRARRGAAAGRCRSLKRT